MRSQAKPPWTLRTATTADQALLSHWDEQPQVRAAMPNSQRDWAVELARELPWRQYLIAELAGRPVAFIELLDAHRDDEQYWGACPAGTRALDIWIGEAADLGQGYGAQIMALALQRLFDDPATTEVLLDQLAENTRAHDFYRRLGFEFIGKRRFEEDDCSIFRLSRQAWLAHQDSQSKPEANS